MIVFDIVLSFCVSLLIIVLVSYLIKDFVMHSQKDYLRFIKLKKDLEIPLTQKDIKFISGLKGGRK